MSAANTPPDHPMKIVVIGGSGLIGSRLARLLQLRGHSVVAASPSTGVNALTGEGLAAALAGAQVVVDVANSPSFADDAVMDFFTRSGHHLLAAEAQAGVAHHVALSVVGTARLQASGYFRAKQAQEEMIAAAGRPYSIVQATQFMEFIAAIAQSAVDGDTLHVPPAEIQPIAADDVAALLADVVLGPPLNGRVEIAGPERMSMAELLTRHLQHQRDGRAVRADPQARYFGTPLEADTLVPVHAAPRLGRARYDDWLAASGAR